MLLAERSLLYRKKENYGDWVRQYMSESYRGANDLMIDMFWNMAWDGKMIEEMN